MKVEFGIGWWVRALSVVLFLVFLAGMLTGAVLIYLLK